MESTAVDDGSSQGKTEILVASWWFPDPGSWPGASNFLTISRSPKNMHQSNHWVLEIKNKNNDRNTENVELAFWLFFSLRRATLTRHAPRWSLALSCG
jgi:hypothetical protein